MKFTCNNYKTLKELSVAAMIYISWILLVVIIVETVPPKQSGLIVPFTIVPFIPLVLKWFYWTAPESHEPESNNKSQVIVPLATPYQQSADIELASL